MVNPSPLYIIILKTLNSIFLVEERIGLDMIQMEGIRQAFVEDNTMEVISVEQYLRRSKLERPAFDNTCVEKDGTLYPIRTPGKCMNYVGAYPMVPGGITGFIDPKEEKKDQYSADKIIDFSHSKNYADYIRKVDQMANEESARLTIKDNVYKPDISPNDSPALKLMKQALEAKNIDPESYRQRLGPDFSNTMRLVTSRKNHSITLKKMVSMAKAYDMEIKLTISDANGAINPMGQEISAIVTDVQNELPNEEGE